MNRVQWHKDGMDVVSSDRLTFDSTHNQLIISGVMATDAGSYTCSIEHDSDYVATDIVLTVAGACV